MQKTEDRKGKILILIINVEYFGKNCLFPFTDNNMSKVVNTATNISLLFTN